MKLPEMLGRQVLLLRCLVQVVDDHDAWCRLWMMLGAGGG